MVLISFSKNGLQNMIDICYRYSCKWRYEYNPNKCGVIVFNESKADFTKCNRKWSLGPNNIKEMESYTHLGIEYCRSVSIEHNVTNACNKLRGSFLGLINSAIHEQGIHPVTSLKCITAYSSPKRYMVVNFGTV